MGHSRSELSNWTNQQLITKEISHRRSIASYVTSLSLTALTTIASAGTLSPLAVPIGAFKVYKIRSHKEKLDMVREELFKRQISPAEKRKRDVLVPVATTFAVYVTTYELSNIIDLVPLESQEYISSEMESLAGIPEGSGGLDHVGNAYEPFAIAEAATPLANQVMKPTLSPEYSQSSSKF